MVSRRETEGMVVVGDFLRMGLRRRAVVKGVEASGAGMVAATLPTAK